MIELIYIILLFLIFYFLYVLIKLYFPKKNKPAIKTNKKALKIDIERSDTGIPYFMVYDTATTGLVPRYHDTFENPYIVEIAWILLDRNFKYIREESFYIQQSKPIPSSATKIHGITNRVAAKYGKPIKEVLDLFLNDFIKVNIQVGHNIDYDIKVLRGELERNGYKPSIMYKVRFVCTMNEGQQYCKLSPKYYYDGFFVEYKPPKLSELAYKCFGTNFKQKHNAESNVLLTVRCFEKLAKDLKLDLDIDKPELILDKYVIKKKKARN